MATVRLTKELEQRLEKLAEITRRSKSFYIKEALERYLEDVEDAFVSLDRVAEPQAKYYTSKEIIKKIDKDEDV